MGRRGKDNNKERAVTDNIVLCRQYLKEQILTSVGSDNRFQEEYDQLVNVLRKTIVFGESDSVLLIGPRGSGKTTLLQHALDIFKDCAQNMIVIKLNGLIHTDDNLALKDIISQLHLEVLQGDKVTGSFSDNLLFLLESLKSGEKDKSKPVIFVLEEFQLFCSHRNQTLLYNLFDGAQSASVPVCVVGLTCRIDVTELLEKRVKSRFSHRQILLLKQPTITGRIALFESLLSINNSKNELGKQMDSIFVYCWNECIKMLASDAVVIDIIEKQLFLDPNESLFRSFLFMLISRLSAAQPEIRSEDVKECYQSMSSDAKVTLLQGLSILELCLVIAMSHQTEIYDGEPFNFEMIFNRYVKFANHNSAIKIVQRSVILKAFERIKALELIAPFSGSTGRNVQKEYHLYNFLLTKQQIKEAVHNYSGLPTDVSRWADSSVL